MSSFAKILNWVFVMLLGGLLAVAMLMKFLFTWDMFENDD